MLTTLQRRRISNGMSHKEKGSLRKLRRAEKWTTAYVPRSVHVATPHPNNIIEKQKQKVT
jgi:hypothetical protein